MKKIHLFYRACIYLALMLTVCHPALQATTVHTLSNQEQSDSLILQGSLKNGLVFALIPSKQLKGGLWIKMDCAILQDEENALLSLLTQHTLFYGTQQYDRTELGKKLNALGLDVEADSFIQSTEKEQTLHFCLPHQQKEEVCDLLALIHQMVFFPTLKNKEIELARNHLLTHSNFEGNEKALALKSITADEVRKFHAQWYYPENMRLTIVGTENPHALATLLPEIFASPIDLTEELPTQQSSAQSLLAFFTERVELASDQQTFVIDGKIWMKEPNWINKSANGKTLGTLLTILGVGGIVLALPIIAPVAIFAGALTTATGVYFLASDYLKDPYYVESLRRTDLLDGCAYAYQKHRAGITLTPYERRALFLEEMVQHPQTLPELPILLLADTYQLNDPIIAEMFITDEFNVLTRLKHDFVQKRNQYKMLKDLLENELASLIVPYALVRDAALLHAKDVYNQNYFVISKKNLKAARDECIKQIEQAHFEHKISLNEKEGKIAQAHDYYNACLSDPAFKTGLDLAESTLIKMELEIEAIYSYQVEMCKQSINYYARMEEIKLGKNAVIAFFNRELTSLLSTFPVYLSLLPDHLDLRSF